MQDYPQQAVVVIIERSCLFCDHIVPATLSKEGGKLYLIEHAKMCDKHPLSKALAERKRLREALVMFIGACTDEELNSVAWIIESSSIPAEEKAAPLNAIKVLLEIK